MQKQRGRNKADLFRAQEEAQFGCSRVIEKVTKVFES